MWVFRCKWCNKLCSRFCQPHQAHSFPPSCSLRRFETIDVDVGITVDLNSSWMFERFHLNKKVHLNDLGGGYPRYLHLLYKSTISIDLMVGKYTSSSHGWGMGSHITDLMHLKGTAWPSQLKMPAPICRCMNMVSISLVGPTQTKNTTVGGFWTTNPFMKNMRQSVKLDHFPGRSVEQSSKPGHFASAVQRPFFGPMAFFWKTWAF